METILKVIEYLLMNDPIFFYYGGVNNCDAIYKTFNSIQIVLCNF